MTSATPTPAPPRSTDLAAQVALVTGASSGLGRRFAVTLAAAGAEVALAARRVDRLAEVAAEIEAAGGTCAPIELDVTDAARIPAAIDEIEAALGTVTILVNNAGIPDAQRAHRMSLELVDAVLDTNVRAPWLLATEVAKRLIAAETPGRIVNISSMGSFNYTGIGAALYSTSKAAVNRMTETLAVEWARYNINVNAIAPGMFASEMSDGMIERIGDPSGSYPRKRLGQPHQLDATLLYLVGPASEVVTGTVLKADDAQSSR